MYRKVIYEKYLSSVNISTEEIEQRFNANINIEKEVLEHLPPHMDAKILDLGCGFGTFLNFLKKKGYKNLFGVDIGQEEYDFLKTKDININQADIFHFLQNTKTTYDLITLFDVLEHFKKDEIIEIIPLLKQRLNKNGVIIVRVPNGEAVFKGSVMYGDLTHETYFTKRSITQLFNIFSFSKVEAFPIFHSAKSWKQKIAKCFYLCYILLHKTLLQIDNPASVEYFVPTQNILCVIRK